LLADDPPLVTSRVGCSGWRGQVPGVARQGAADAGPEALHATHLLRRPFRRPGSFVLRWLPLPEKIAGGGSPGRTERARSARAPRPFGRGKEGRRHGLADDDAPRSRGTAAADRGQSVRGGQRGRPKSAAGSSELPVEIARSARCSGGRDARPGSRQSHRRHGARPAKASAGYRVRSGSGGHRRRTIMYSPQGRGRTRPDAAACRAGSAPMVRRPSRVALRAVSGSKGSARERPLPPFPSASDRVGAPARPGGYPHDRVASAEEGGYPNCCGLTRDCDTLPPHGDCTVPGRRDSSFRGFHSCSTPRRR
jgi:hypothetical protein